MVLVLYYYISLPPILHVVSAQARVKDSTMIIVRLHQKVVRRRKLAMMDRSYGWMDGWIEMAVACIILYDSILAEELSRQYVR